MLLLPETQYPAVLTKIEKVSINHYFAKAVLLKRALGKVYVDQLTAPCCYYIICDYGMSLLFGNPEKNLFIKKVAQHMATNSLNFDKPEWLQVYPQQWHQLIESQLKEQQLTITSVQTRVNFNFEPSAFSQLKAPEKLSLVKPITAKHFDSISGDVAPKHFWKNSEEFTSYGKGFVIELDSNIASTAYSSCIDRGILEIGIETDKAYRNKGLAFTVAYALIKHCLEYDIKPVWACRKENQASYLLAQKLGFKPTKFLPYYQLVKS